jgi:hypothetical protein
LKKTLLVISLLALCCSLASAGTLAKSKTYTFGLETASGGGEYCNYLTWFTWGDNYSLAAGQDNLTADCGYSSDASLIGEKGTISSASGYPAVSGYAMGNNEDDTACDCNDGYAIQYVAGTKAGQNWVVFVWDNDADGFFDNYGTLSSVIPDVAKNHSTLRNAARLK